MSKIRAILLVFVALCGLRAQAQDTCGPYSVRGIYAMSYQGSVYQYTTEGTLAPVSLPVVWLGQITVKAVKPFSAMLSGWGDVAVGTQTMKAKVSGSVDLRSDCTATATYFLQPDGAPAPSPTPVEEEWIVLKGGDRMRVIITKFPFGQQVTLGTGERIATGE